MTEVVHILDRFLPELQQYLLIEDIGGYLIAEGLLSYEDYLMLTERTSKKKAIVELLQLVKSKGPHCLQSFLHALHRSCTETSTPHQGHHVLWDLFQANMSGVQYPLKKQKSKSVLSKLTRTKRNKNSKSNKELSPPLWVPTSHSTAMNSHKYDPSLTGTMRTCAGVSPLASRRLVMSSATLRCSPPSDEDNYRQLSNDSTSSDDAYHCELLLPPSPLPPPGKTEQCVTQAPIKENMKLKEDLKRKTKKLEEQNVKIKEYMQYNEELKTENEMYKSKMQILEDDGEILTSQLKAKNDEIAKHTSLIDELKDQVTSLQLTIHKVMQEKESLEESMQGSLIPTRGPNSRPQRSHSLDHMHVTSESSYATSTSLASINEIEEFKYELNRIDAVLHSKLNLLAQVCQDTMREPSTLNRKWHSDNKLVQPHHQENTFLHSQT